MKETNAMIAKVEIEPPPEFPDVIPVRAWSSKLCVPSCAMKGENVLCCVKKFTSYSKKVTCEKMLNFDSRYTERCR